MTEDVGTGGWRRGQTRAAERSGTPESRPRILDGSPRTAGPQPRDVLRLALQELRTGEWVTEPAARGGPRRQDPPVSDAVGSVNHSG
jgi:hypothetical protein